jgi:hypothetical protein
LRKRVVVVVDDVAVVVVVGPPEPTMKVPIMVSACGSQRYSYVPSASAGTEYVMVFGP